MLPSKPYDRIYSSRAQTISSDVAARIAARRKIIEKAQRLERDSYKAMMQRKRQLQHTSALDTISWHMTNEEKILTLLEKQGNMLEQQGKALATLQADVAEIKQGQNDQGVAIGRITTVLQVLEAGQNDVRENMSTKADVQDIKAEQTKLKRRIENIEESTKTPNPHKN